ncbi:hypothetical protein SEA_SHAGRAT_92 [Rhodococcus phage Shagrat]|nr:hypothetical protein SEA_SHAGRAT_92 [Rhodococcus phage Shagrat]
MKNLDIAFKLAVVALLTVMTIAVVVTAVELVDYLEAGRSAWTAPWVNVINRGPVQ